MKNLLLQQSEIRSSLIKTLCYADIFDFPLTFSEMWKYYIGKNNISKQELRFALKLENSYIKRSKNYFYIDGREKIVIIRKQRALESKKKFKKAEKIARLLSLIPTIQVVGISGSLAIGNSKKNDDIDFFIITKPHSLWISRFLASVLLLVLREKRKRNLQSAKDKICLNMFMSAHSLTISERNLFMVHEISQVKVIINKSNIYEQFLLANSWVVNFLPHAINVNYLNKNTILQSSSTFPFFANAFNFLLTAIESIFYKVQLLYMRSNMTREYVRKDIARFHPDNKKNKILGLYRKRYKRFLNPGKIQNMSDESFYQYSGILTS